MFTDSFLLTTCHAGAERSLKAEITRVIPDARFAFSRPGLLTFKLAENLKLSQIADLAEKLVFPQTVSLSLGKINLDAGEKNISVKNAASECWRKVEAVLDLQKINTIHVWQRNCELPTNTETFAHQESRREKIESVKLALQKTAPPSFHAADFTVINNVADNVANNSAAQSEQKKIALDVIIEEENSWWLGCHEIRNWHSQFAGGAPPIPINPDAVSRAWYKFEEALLWSQFPITENSRCVDLGASPGGASQALLARGTQVIGIDPGEIDARVAAHPHFTHLQRRTPQVRRRDLRKCRWLIADMNVAPAYTLEVLEDLVTHPEISLRGLLFTVKLFHWGQTVEIPTFIAKLHSLGYNQTRVRHLAFNRQEVMVAALQVPFRRKEFYVD